MWTKKLTERNERNQSESLNKKANCKITAENFEKGKNKSKSNLGTLKGKGSKIPESEYIWNVWIEEGDQWSQCARKREEEEGGIEHCKRNEETTAFKEEKKEFRSKLQRQQKKLRWHSAFVEKGKGEWQSDKVSVRESWAWNLLLIGQPSYSQKLNPRHPRLIL